MRNGDPCRLLSCPWYATTKTGVWDFWPLRIESLLPCPEHATDCTYLGVDDCVPRQRRVGSPGGQCLTNWMPCMPSAQSSVCNANSTLVCLTLLPPSDRCPTLSQISKLSDLPSPSCVNHYRAILVRVESRGDSSLRQIPLFILCCRRERCSA